MATINKKYGQTYIATATPNTGYRFVRWTGTGVSTTDNPATLTCLGDNTIEAIFERLQYTVNVGVYPVTSGTIVFDPAPPTPTVKNVISYTLDVNSEAYAGPLTGTWIENNTDTSLNTYDSSTGMGKLYLTTDVIGGGQSTAYSPFYNRVDLSSIDILGPSEEFGGLDATLTTIGAYTFYGCTSLMYPMISDSVTTVGDYAFANSGYTENGFNPSTIGAHAFDGCGDLQSLSTDTGFEGPVRPLTSIGPGAFFNINDYTEIYLTNTSTPPTCTGAIFNQNTVTVYVPQGSLSTYQANQYWNVVNLVGADW